MPATLQEIARVYRDFETSGLPASGEHDPIKREIRGLLADMLAAIGNGGTNLSPSFQDQVAQLVNDLEGFESAVQDVDADRIQVSSDKAVVVALAADADADAAAAESAKTAAIAAAETAGPVAIYDTNAAAVADVASIPANAVIVVLTDEDHENRRTFYRKESGVLVYKRPADVTPAEVGAIIGVVTPVLNSTGAAAANVALLQNALNLGGDVRVRGSGICWINDTLVIGENTALLVDDSVEIKQVATGSKPLLVNACLNRPWVGCSLAWSAGNMTATLTKVAHGQLEGQSIWVRGTPGTTDPAYFGNFLIVGVSDANNLVVLLRRKPAASPSGTIEAKRADQNIVIKGRFNYNYSGGAGSAPAEDWHQHAIIPAGIRGLEMNVKVTDTPKMGVCNAALTNFDIRAEGYGVAEIVKTYGPAFDGKIHVTGQSVDDTMSLQPREPSVFVGYDFSGGGDVLGIRCENATRAFAGGVPASDPVKIYPSPDFLVDQIVYDGLANYASAHSCLKIRAYDADALVGRVEINNVRVADTPSGGATISTEGGVIVDELVINGVTGPANPTNATPVIEINATDLIRRLTLSSVTRFIPASAQVISIAGTVDHLHFERSKIDGESGAYGVQVFGSGEVGRTTVRDVQWGALSAGIFYMPGATGDHLEFTGNTGALTVGINTAADMTMVVADNDLPDISSAGFVRLNKDAGAFKIIDRGGNNPGSGQWLVRSQLTEVVTVEGFGFKVDPAFLARTNGSYCFNPEPTRGTLGSAGLVICQGTSTGSWKLLADTTKTF